MRINLVAGTVLCLVAVSSSAFSQNEKGKREGFDGKAREMMMRRAGEGGPGMPGAMLANLPVIAALDSDKDGSLSASEIANASKALLTLDKNGDGVVSGEEMRPAFNPMAGGPRPGEAGGAEAITRMFASQDANGDGKLSGDEIPERMRERVAMIDENGDGEIDKSEFQKIAARMAGAAGKGGDRPGPGGKNGSGVRPKRPGQDN